jgi:membrane-bound metal-dependent hydrolase YbcI (DUF457 family)
MPFTPYHFGPAGFIAILFKKWVDVPVFLLANVAIDIEVGINIMLKRPWIHAYTHTLIGGILVGVILALVSYPLRGFYKKIMGIFRLSYQTNFRKLLIWSVLGVWFHILIDSFDHWDVRPFWPFINKNPFFGYISDYNIRMICLVFWVLLLILLAINYIRNKPCDLKLRE